MHREPTDIICASNNKTLDKHRNVAWIWHRRQAKVKDWLSQKTMCYKIQDL